MKTHPEAKDTPVLPAAPVAQTSVTKTMPKAARKLSTSPSAVARRQRRAGARAVNARRLLLKTESAPGRDAKPATEGAEIASYAPALREDLDAAQLEAALAAIRHHLETRTKAQLIEMYLRGEERTNAAYRGAGKRIESASISSHHFGVTGRSMLGILLPVTVRLEMVRELTLQVQRDLAGE